MHAYTQPTPHQDELMLLHMRLVNNLSTDPGVEFPQVMAIINAEASPVEREELLKSAAFAAIACGSTLDWIAYRLSTLGARLDFEAHPPVFPHVFPYRQTPASHLVERRLAPMNVAKMIAHLQQCDGFDLHALDPETGKTAAEVLVRRIQWCQSNDPLAVSLLQPMLSHVI